MDVMKFFMADGIPVLPIHDSFIIRAGFWQYLEKAMQTAFQERFGSYIPVTQDGSMLPEHLGCQMKIWQLLIKMTLNCICWTLNSCIQKNALLWMVTLMGGG